MNRTRLFQLASWLVHAYTASGGVMGFFALLAASKGESRQAFLLLMLAFFVDVTDGILARRVGVRIHLPRFSGARIDDAVDVLTYIYVPLFILAQEGVLPHAAWLVPPLLAGLYAYGQSDMKTDDHYFLGFPSYWNVVALYLFWFQPGPTVAVACIIVPTVLTVIPTRYLYPSRNAVFWKTNFILGGIWLALVCWLLLKSEPSQLLIGISLFYPAIYMGLSFYADWKARSASRGAIP
jgi:phosphatidylcholine synthase